MDNLRHELQPSVLDRFGKMLPASWTGRGALIPVLRFTGAIGVSTPLRPGLSLSTFAGAIEKAFTMRGAKAVAIQINSPGGSAVQSRLIFQRIRDLATEKKVRVYVFAEDVAASGGYMIACAGDEIYADPSSVVGSIGVLYQGFGFTRLIEKIGVDRRVHTAGERKMSLDPFQEENTDDIERLKNIENDPPGIHFSCTRSPRGKDRSRRRSVIHRRVLERTSGI